MAAYAALVSLSHTLHQILHPPPLNEIIFYREQIVFLQGKVSFMIHFLETYSSGGRHGIAKLERRITDAAYAAENIIESNVMEQIHAATLCEGIKPIEQYAALRLERCDDLWYQSCIPKLKDFLSAMIRMFGMMDAPYAAQEISSLLCEDIKMVTKKFLSIEKELINIEVKGDLQPKSSTAASWKGLLPNGNITMVGFEENMTRIMEALATDESIRQIISIVGMGGIGKTTLASAIYNNPFVVEHFYIRAWVTVSQEYTVRVLLLRILSEITKVDQNKQECTDDEIGELQYKEVFYRKYLIVMDEMWDIEAWDKVQRFFPDNENGSRILVTKRLLNLAKCFGPCSLHQISVLDEEKSWALLHGKVIKLENQK